MNFSALDWVIVGGRKGGEMGRGFGYGKKVNGDFVGLLYDVKTSSDNKSRSGYDFYKDITYIFVIA